MLNAAIISAIEDFAPVSLQESWDNTGVQVGSLRAECQGVMLCVDVTPAIVREAHDKGCNLIISHHPLIFKGLKRITGNTPVEESVMLAISFGITIYSSHTAVDSTRGGVSYRMAKMLGAEPQKVLSPLSGKKKMIKVTALTETSASLSTVFDDLTAGGSVVFSKAAVNRSVTDSDDAFGTTVTTSTECIVAEAVVDSALVAGLHDSLFASLGDKLISVETIGIEDTDPAVGLGVYALLPNPMTAIQLIDKIKQTFGSPLVRCTALPDKDIKISRIAMCGGSGSEFISTAIRAGAQAYITSDTRYHDFVDFQNQILIADIGHFESESCTKDIFFDVIRKKFPNFACYKSQFEENPIKYL